MRFGEWMRMRRNEQDITIYRLAKVTGISRQQLANYEDGASDPTLEKAQMVCKALHGEFVLGGD